SCSSHMSIEGNSLTCELLRGRDHDGDDDEDDGDGLKVLSMADVTVRLSTATLTGRSTRPQVWNVTFDPESNQAVVQVRSPYHNDYLTADNQLFQLHIWTTKTHLKMDMEHLWRNTEYQVAVRAIPVKLLAGSWSEWSETSRFLTPRREMLIKLLVCLLPLLLVTVTALFFRKNKIFMYMWPNIPHPKDTLVQICKPNKGLLLNLNPEVFSALRVSPTLQPREETEPPLSPDDDALSDDPGSTQSSDCRSTATEELEFSALLSRSSSDGEDGLHSDAPSPVQDPRLGGGGTEAQVFGRGQQEEAYVTMSSFYQIK
uniref:Fibronectin type-III domain-containing protein n=1 Tax=Scophthalmus maximus TaxID=52904 RepID=A0A8D3CYV4_SCOMX